MKITFLPQTKIGKWAVGFMVMWPLLTVLGAVVVNAIYPGVESGNGIVDDLRVRPLLAATMLLGIALGVISLPMSLVVILKKAERSILSIITALLGLFLILFLLGELLLNINMIK